MKKILLAVFFLMLVTTPVFAKKTNNYHINFDGKRYNLLYSVKSSDFGGYLNEYYKNNETYNTWSEMLAVHHFPNAYSPIEQVKQFRAYLGSMNCPSALISNEKKNTAVIDFLLINNNQIPIILEFNVFKYQKSKQCGSVALQYAKRYAVTTAMQVDEAKRDFEKSRKKIIKKVENYEIPQVISEDIDKCKFVLDTEREENIQDTNNKEFIEKTEITEEANKGNSDSIVKDTEVKDTETKEEIKEVKEVLPEKEEITEKAKEEEKIIENKKIETQSEQKNENAAIQQKPVTKTDEKTEIQKEPVTKANEKAEVLKEQKEVKELKKSAEYAPVPVEDDSKNLKNKKQKVKNIKKENYTLEHDNSDFFAEKRNYKQLRKDKKKQQKELKHKQKLEQKRLKAEQKLNSKKSKKARVKKASKNLEEI